jgi:hypothetical protein
VKLYTEAVLELENWKKNDEFKLRRCERDTAEGGWTNFVARSSVCNSLQSGRGCFDGGLL